MTDLEMTSLAAEAMGIDCTILGGSLRINPYHNDKYDPLHDDAQAMALVKHFRLTIYTDALFDVEAPDDSVNAMSDDLNRAIVECVAKMQAAKDVER